MNKMPQLAVVLCLALVAVILLLSPSQSLSNGQAPADYVPDELIVKFKADVTTLDMDALNAKIGVQIIRHFRLIDAHLLKLPQGLSVEKAIELFEQSPLVEYAEPNYIVTINATTPNDPRAGELWGLNNIGQTGGTADADIDAPEAWDMTTGSSSTVIAVVDTGVDYNHEDLIGNIWVNPGEDLNGNGVFDQTDINGIDDDNNGYVDDLIGWDFANNDNNPFDDNEHGTHVSGTIAAKGNNSIGVVGVNWNAKIMALKFLNRLGSGSTSDAITAIDYHEAKGVKVSSNSWGGGRFSQSLYNAIQACNCLFVAAAGNDGKNTDNRAHYPSSYNLINIVSVASTDHKDIRTSFSNY
ncbi:MAG: S8 family serine peptidase, partial [Deltaproteobacteria bacterium]|nr:S8 family serine peptidase [Deltaproteobacteria bacterium]